MNANPDVGIQTAGRPGSLTAPVRLVAGGDVMLGRQMPGWVGLRGASDPLAGVAHLFQAADLALVNLEICISLKGDMINKGGRQPYYYHAHPGMLDVLTHAGVGCVATANNHAMDFGPEALAEQTDILASCGFVHFGAGHNLAQAASPRYVRVGGVTLALIGVETETPVMAAGEASPGIYHVSLKALAQMLAEPIAQARRCADLVLVSPHWGANWLQAPSEEIRSAAKALIALGADAVLGHSAHVLQGVEFYLGRPIIYDMGTLLFDRVTQQNMKDTALFELMWTPEGGCELTIRPVKLSTARARLAQGGDFLRIGDDLQRMSLALDASLTIERSEAGLHLRGLSQPTAMHCGPSDLAPSVVEAPLRPAVTSQLRERRSNLVYASSLGLEGMWETPLQVNPDLLVLGARYAHPIRSERGFVCEVFFRARAPAPATRIEARVAAFDADGTEVFAYVHPVAEGIHPPALWRWQDIICDRICVRPVKSVPDGVYRLCWSLLDLQTGQTLPVDADDARCENGQVFLGDLTVSKDAPATVVGIAAAPLLPRAAPSLQATPGGWQGRVAQYWQDEAGPWVAQRLSEIGLAARPGLPEVVRDAPLSLVLRVETPNGAYFFKALEHKNSFEPALVALLSQRWADRIAVPLATDPGRGWMLTVDHGVPLGQTGNAKSRARALQDAAARLAEIQLASCDQVDQLLALGVPDRRLDQLPAHFEALLNDAQALQLGHLDSLRPDELQQAQSLLPRLQAVCRDLLTRPCAAALDHGDLHLNNLLVKDGRVVLFDWDTAWVTHPFCSLLLPYQNKGVLDSASLAALLPLAQAYLCPWSIKTTRSVADLLPSLYQALWVAHVKRALFWSESQEVSQTGTQAAQNMVAKWVRLWINRADLLAPGLSAACAPVARPATLGPSIQPAKLATPENPLLLDANLVAALTGGTWTRAAKELFFSGMSFKRAYTKEGTSGNLFFAVQHDVRNKFPESSIAPMARAALAEGAAAVVVPQNVQGLSDDLPLLRISPDIDSLQLLGEHVRDHLFTGRRVLVSGTEGKTGFKNMLHHVLSPQIGTHAVTNSSNLGFSIMASLASIRKNDRVAILEAAGTHPGRLAVRSGYVKPHLFVLTEVGNEHINFHGSQQAVIESKADIAVGLVEGGFGILNADSRNYDATRRAVLGRKRVPLCLFGTGSHCNGRLVASEFKDNAWTVSADIEGQLVQYRLPLLGDHAPLASVSVLLSAYYLGADAAQAAAEFETFRPYESQGALRRLAHRGGVITCYDNASRASMLSYRSTLGMAAKLTPPTPGGKKVGVIGQMIFLGDESEPGHAQLAPWVDAAEFDRVILVGKYTEVTFVHLKNPGVVVARFPQYDRRTSTKAELQALIEATEAACNPGDLLFVKGEVDELGQYLRTKELPSPRPNPLPMGEGKSSESIEPTRSPETGGSNPLSPRERAGMGAGAPALTSAPKRASNSAPDLSVLDGLRPLRLDDLPHYRHAIDPTQRTTWQHYFPLIYLLGRAPGSRFLVNEDAGAFCVYLLRSKQGEQFLSLFLLPMPAEPAVIERCIARVQAFARGGRASLFRVDEADTALFAGRPNTRIVRCPPEYIYAAATYRDLSGNKNGNLRRAIGAIAKRPDLEVLDYQASDAAQCKQLLDQWADLQREKYGAVLYGSYTRDCLDLYDQFSRDDLFGKVVKLDGSICAFGFAGAMRTGMGNQFIAYSDLRIDGLNRFLWVRLLGDMERLELVNGGNAGDTPGLAFAKQSLRPVSLFQPYQVYAG